MKKKNYFKLNDFISKLDENEYVNLYDDTGFTVNIKVKDVSNDFLIREVLKYKADNAIPNIHFKLGTIMP